MLVKEEVADNRDHCDYECRCFNAKTCEISISVVQPGDRVLCDIITTDSDKCIDH